MPNVTNAKFKKKPIYNIVKRLFDLLFSFIFLLLLAFPILIISIIVVIDSKGKPIFGDLRVGKNHKAIKVYKFRSMVHDAESNIDNYLTSEQKEIWIRKRKLDNDPRVTKFGRILRKTSIDEITQLWNIFIGNLSFVGPRPITECELEYAYTKEEQELLLSVKPGLTGAWQVYGREDAEFNDGKRQKLELDYIANRGIITDIKILFLTIPAILKHKEYIK